MERIAVCENMIRYPLATTALPYFHYVLGLLCLGHDALYFEESGWPESWYNRVNGPCREDPAYGLQTVQILMAISRVKVPLCHVNRDTGQIQGLRWRDVVRMLHQTDLLLNLRGVRWLPEFRLSRRINTIKSVYCAHFPPHERRSGFARGAE